MVKIFQFLRLSTKFLAVFRLSINPIETLMVRENWIISKQNPTFQEHPYLTHISKVNSFYLSSHISLLNG